MSRLAGSGGIGERLRPAWAELRERRDLQILALLVLAGLVLRAWLMVAWQPGMLGYNDSGGYLATAQSTLYRHPMQPGGYPLFLRGIHLFSSRYEAIVLVQHALGVAGALLLWAATRRLGAPRWAALVPAALALLSGTAIFMEHAVLSEPLYIFLQALAIYAWARIADGRRALAWAGVVGLAIGFATIARVIGLPFIPLLVAAVALAPAAGWRPRLGRAAVTAAAALAIVFTYMAEADRETGVFGITRAGGWNLYARTAVFAECPNISVPDGAQALCEERPPAQRPGPSEYNFNPAESPALNAFNWQTVSTPEDNEKLTGFARAAIFGQPLRYLETVLKDMRRYWDSDGWFRPGPGLSYAGIVEDSMMVLEPRDFRPYWSNPPGYSVSGAQPLIDYERVTRVQGPFLLVLLLLAVAAPLLARGARERVAAAVPALIGLGGLVVPVAGYMYDARFAMPAYAPLAVAAALALGAISRRRSPP